MKKRGKTEAPKGGGGRSWNPASQSSAKTPKTKQAPSWKRRFPTGEGAKKKRGKIMLLTIIVAVAFVGALG